MEFGGDVGADDILDAYPGGLDLASLKRVGLVMTCLFEWCLEVGVHGSAPGLAIDRTYFEKMRHFSPVLFRFRRIFLLDHSKPRNRELELHLEPRLPDVSALSQHVVSAN